MSAISRPAVLGPGEGHAVDLGLGRPTIKLGPPQGGSQIGLVEGDIPPGGGFRVPHWHDELDEVFYVLEGEIQRNGTERGYGRQPADHLGGCGSRVVIRSYSRSRAPQPAPAITQLRPRIDPKVGQVEVGGVMGAVLGLLPRTVDAPAVGPDDPGEALRKRLTLAPEPPRAIADAHLIHACHAPIIGVQLNVGSVGRIAPDDREAARRARHVDRRLNDQVCAGLMPPKDRLALPRPRLAGRTRCQQSPLANQRL